jgi:hypothetical protein
VLPVWLLTVFWYSVSALGRSLSAALLHLTDSLQNNTAGSLALQRFSAVTRAAVTFRIIAVNYRQ